MAQSVLNRLDVHSVRDELSCLGVPQLVESKSRKTTLLAETTLPTTEVGESQILCLVGATYGGLARLIEAKHFHFASLEQFPLP